MLIDWANSHGSERKYEMDSKTLGYLMLKGNAIF